MSIRRRRRHNPFIDDAAGVRDDASDSDDPGADVEHMIDDQEEECEDDNRDDPDADIEHMINDQEEECEDDNRRRLELVTLEMNTSPSMAFASHDDDRQEAEAIAACFLAMNRRQRDATLAQDPVQDYSALPNVKAHLERVMHRYKHQVYLQNWAIEQAAAQINEVIALPDSEPMLDELALYAQGLPHTSDCEMYEIGCQSGYEEVAVCLAFQTMTSPIVKSVTYNPSHPSRVYVEVERWDGAMHVAKNVAHLNPWKIRFVPESERLQTLFIRNRPLVSNTWVKILSPRSLSGRIGFVANSRQILVIPRGQGCGTDGLMRACFDQANQVPLIRPQDTNFIQLTSFKGRNYDAHGFRVLSPSECRIETGRFYPTLDEVNTFARYLKISNRVEIETIAEINANALSLGLKVKATRGELTGLVGTVHSLQDHRCTVLFPGHSAVQPVSLDVLSVRRDFALGDLVQFVQHPSVGWIININKTDASITVSIPSQNTDIVTHRYSIDFHQPCVSNLRKAPSLPHKSNVTLGKAYSLEFPQSDRNMLRAQGGSVHRVGSIIGTVVCIESAGLIVFSPTMYGTSDLALQLGDCVRLKDWDDGFGEGLVTGLTETNITIGNLSPSLQLPNVQAGTSGPYDHHIDKLVLIVGEGSYKAYRAIVKNVDPQGKAVVELQIQPPIKVHLHVKRLVAILDDNRYSFTIGGYLEGSSAVIQCVPEWPWLPAQSLTRRPSTPEQSADCTAVDVQDDCAWLTGDKIQDIPVKLHRKLNSTKVPYEFLQTHGKIVSVKDRGKIKSMALDTLRWMIPTEVRQLVVCVGGDYTGQTFYILDYSESGRECVARKHPKDANTERFTIPIHTLAQIWNR